MTTVKSQGTAIKVGDASPGTYNGIAEITGFSGPDGQAAEIPVTNLLSTAVEVIPGLADNGRMTLNVNFDPSDTNGQTRCRTLRDGGTLGYFKIEWPDTGSTVWTFTAYVLGMPVEGAVDQPVTGQITLRVSGAITIS